MQADFRTARTDTHLRLDVGSWTSPTTGCKPPGSHAPPGTTKHTCPHQLPPNTPCLPAPLQCHMPPQVHPISHSSSPQVSLTSLAPPAPVLSNLTQSLQVPPTSHSPLPRSLQPPPVSPWSLQTHMNPHPRSSNPALSPLGPPTSHDPQGPSNLILCPTGTSPPTLHCAPQVPLTSYS